MADLSGTSLKGYDLHERIGAGGFEIFDVFVIVDPDDEGMVIAEVDIGWDVEL